MKRIFTRARLTAHAAVFILVVPTLAHGASGPKKLPVCNGKHLRDVNIYGSVLPGSPIPAIVASPAPPPVPQIAPAPEGVPPPPPVPVPPADKSKTSAVNTPRTYRSC